MDKILAVFIGIEDEVNVVTGGERQQQEMIRKLKEHGVDVLFIKTGDSLEPIINVTNMYEKEYVYIISDYSKRFQCWRMNWICRYKYKFNVCCMVGAFYFDYRTSRIKNGIDYVISYLYLKPAKLIFTTGQAVSRKLCNMGCKKKRIKDIYPAIRESLIEEAKQDIDLLNNSNKEKIVLTVGRFHPVKGYDYLLEAVKFCADMPDIHFVIVGDYERKPDDYYKKIMKRIYEEGLNDKITVYGKTKDDCELASLYRRAWCCVHTSVWESSPITVCEILLFGKPVIATDVGGTSEYLENGEDSILVPAKDGTALGKALNRLYTDSKLYKHLCVNAKISAKKYVDRTWNDVGEEYVQEIMKRYDK